MINDVFDFIAISSKQQNTRYKHDQLENMNSYPESKSVSSNNSSDSSGLFLRDLTNQQNEYMNSNNGNKIGTVMKKQNLRKIFENTSNLHAQKRHQKYDEQLLDFSTDNESPLLFPQISKAEPSKLIQEVAICDIIEKPKHLAPPIVAQKSGLTLKLLSKCLPLRTLSHKYSQADLYLIQKFSSTKNQSTHRYSNLLKNLRFLTFYLSIATTSTYLVSKKNELILKILLFRLRFFK